MIPPLAALFSWPIISFILFRTQRLQYAILITIVGGYLLLPERTNFNLPLIPTLDKDSVPSIVALLLALAFAAPTQGLRGLLQKGVLFNILLFTFVFSAFLTGITNTDAVRIGPTVLPGIRPYDGFSTVLSAMITVLPLLIARKYLADVASQRFLLLGFVIAALAYTPFVLIELRMSPQMNNWVYGFFPHGWIQHVRSNGYRPLVFLEHGLRLAIFLSAASMAAMALSRAWPERRMQFLGAAAWLFLMVFLSKSFGALLITLVFIPVLFFLSARLQLLTAAILGIIILLYPMGRASGQIPVDRLQELVAHYSEDRAASFGTRLENEDELLAKANQRPIFGWGGWGRSRIVDERGNDSTIADGRWIIVFGLGGWVRYISEYGLLVIPIVLLFFQSRKLALTRETATLALIMTANLIDMIPNSSMTPLTWLVAGSLWGRLELKANAPQADQAPQTEKTLLRPRNAHTQKLEPDAEIVVETGSKTRYTRQTERKTRLKN